jgi:hypothetical protein
MSKASELAARKVDVFLAVGTERALRAALLAAEGKPIVLLAIDFDPVTRGYKPSDMPIEQSPRFYMAVNLKTAASLGITLPDVFVARANEVRE